MPEFDYNTVLIYLLVLALVLILLYEIRKPKGLGSMNPQTLLERINEYQDVLKNLKSQLCWCGKPMTVKEVDLFEKNMITLGCECGATVQWSLKSGKGLKGRPSWGVIGKKGATIMKKVKEVAEPPPGEKSIIEKVSELTEQGEPQTT